MSYYDYRLSGQLMIKDPPFNALIMAAMRKADTNNMIKLCAEFPELHEELQARYNAPGGFLPGEPQIGLGL